MPEPKILILDIETSPNLGYFWGIWKQNIGLDQIRETSEIMCWAAKWYDEKKIHYGSYYKDSKLDMLTRLRTLLDEADIVVHYNGKKFDIPIINKDLLMFDIAPPSPYKQIDLLETAKHVFKFQSNRLEFICQQLGIGEKEKHGGFKLWKDCLAGDKQAWDLMKKYNIKDVVITEKLYKRIKPWMATHPRLYDDPRKCPFCNSDQVHRKQNRISIKYRYTQFQCQSCGKHYMGSKVKKDDK